MATLLESDPEPGNVYAKLIQGQKFARITNLYLESGDVLTEFPVAYKTWGSLNEAKDNVLVICHALTGSSDVEDWWQPLIGAGKAFDPAHFFIFCANVLGSPYGSASPLTTDSKTGRRFASDFPQTTTRDDVRAHKHVLDALGVQSIAAVIGGSMGGMTTLEWPLCTPHGYVRSIIPIATAADHSAWGISWAETQRQCIYADPKFNNGDYEPNPDGQPSSGLAAARMVAMLTYRSCMSFDQRFGRKPQKFRAPAEEPLLDLPRTDMPIDLVSKPTGKPSNPAKRSLFSAQGYLHYQGEKFVRRFDANCYLHITNKMDMHDVLVGRVPDPSIVGQERDIALKSVLSEAPPGALVVSVESDALFLPEQQERLVSCLPQATLAMLRSQDGHDGFLLEFEQLNHLIRNKLVADFPELYKSKVGADWVAAGRPEQQKESLAGEVEDW